MKLYLRLLWLLLTQSHGPRCQLLGPCTTNLRVLPNDLDLMGHVNNGVYLTMMDLARTDLLLRTDKFWAIAKKGWYPVVAAETIRFHRSLRLWQKFEIITEVVGWDQKSIFLQQRFEYHGELIATAVVNARFLRRASATGGAGSVTTDEFLEFAQLDVPRPETPKWILEWHSSMFCPGGSTN